MKLAEQDVVRIVRDVCDSGRKHGDVALDFSRVMVAAIMNGRSWSSVTGFQKRINPGRGPRPVPIAHRFWPKVDVGTE